MQKTTETTAEKRTIATIAREIKRLWARPYFGSVPYLDAMLVLETTDRDASYGLDSARSIVTYFLSNATTWRGDDARRIKKELKAYSY